MSASIIQNGLYFISIWKLRGGAPAEGVEVAEAKEAP